MKFETMIPTQRSTSPNSRRFGFSKWHLCAAAIVILAFLASATPAQELEQVYLVKSGLDQPNAPVVVDTVHDDVPEVIVTDVRGAFHVYNSATGALIASHDFGESLSPPVVGDFRGNGSLDIAFGSGSGRMIVVDGTTFDVLNEQQTASPVSIQPSVVTISDGDRTHDMIVVHSQDGFVRAFVMGEDGQLARAWQANSGARFQAPAAVGSVRQRGRPDIVATTGDGHLLIIDPYSGEFEKLLVKQLKNIQTTPLLVDITGDGRDEIVVTIQGGEMFCYEYDSSKSPRHVMLWTRATLRDSSNDPVLIGRGNDITSLFVLQVSDSSLYLVDAHTGNEVVFETGQEFGGINTQVSLIPRRNQFPEIVFGLKKTLQTSLNLSNWVVGEGGTDIRFAAGTLGESLFSTISVARVDEGGVMLISFTPQGILYGYRSPHSIAPGDWPTSSPWMTRGSTSRHNPKLDLVYARRLRDIKDQNEQRAALWAADLAKAKDSKNWDEAVRLSNLLVEYDPLNSDYQSQHLRVTVLKNLIAIIGIVVGLILIGGFTSWKAFKAIGRNRLRRRAESAIAREDYAAARESYEALLAKAPRKDKVAIPLSQVYMAQRDYSGSTLEVFQLAWNAMPNDTKLTHAYARALLIEPKTTDEAAKVYQQAIQSFPEPQLLEYGLGRYHLARKEYEEAGKRLRAALRGGFATNDVYNSLCEVYLETGNYTSKALPVFEQQFPNRQQDQRFLEAYLSACIDAKKADAQVESLCQAVLEQNHHYIPAYLHLALVQLQKNQVGSAIEEVRQALKVEPENEQAAGLLAHCYLIQNRKDEEAVAAYRKALKFDAGDRELLRVLAAVNFEHGKYDREAVDVYHRSHAQNPADIPTLRALAQTAQLSNDPDLAISSIEALFHQGQSNQALNSQLAGAYLKKQNFEPGTEKIFREALRAEPNNADYIKALSSVLLSQDRTEVDTIPVYEQQVANFKDDIQTGRQLAKAYIKNDRYESALETAQRFLKLAPEDEELQRLNALASLYDNKIDEAVSEYKRILERNPEDREALVNLALAYGQKHRTDDEAQKVYERALEIQESNDLLHVAMARVKALQNDLSEAVECYRRALKAREDNMEAVVGHVNALLAEQPQFLRIRWFLVEVLVAQGHLRESLEQIRFITDNHPGQEGNLLRALEKIAEKDPRNISALILRGSLLLSSGKPDEAIAPLQQANELQPGSAEIQEKLTEALEAMLDKKEDAESRFALGTIYYQQQEYDPAIGCFQKTAQDYRWEAESTKMLGKCFTSKGMLDLALQEFKKLVVDDDTKELLYDLAQRYEAKKDLVGAKTVYRQLFAADIDYKDVKSRFEMLSGSTSDPMAFEKTSIVEQMSEKAARRYELLDELGRGAMGIVYRARDKELEEVVALKILPDNMSNNPEAVRRFKIEARNARKLSHPNIVRIHDIGEEMGRKYISMEYVDGSDLKKKIKSSPDFKIAQVETIKYVVEIADALAYAHRLGIVHRDIKPANIMLTSQEEVKVTDFGIAKMMDQPGDGTMIGAVIGTPLYMSPEQVQGIPVDNRADIYAFGVMFYELLNGRPPFTEGDLAYQHLHKEPEPIEGVDDDLWAIVQKCLAKKKEDRWENAEQVVEALRGYQKAAG